MSVRVTTYVTEIGFRDIGITCAQYTEGEYGSAEEKEV